MVSLKEVLFHIFGVPGLIFGLAKENGKEVAKNELLREQATLQTKQEVRKV